MTVDEVLAAARARSGLDDIGDPAILDGLERLLSAYATEARFTPHGAQMAHEELVTNLVVRMKVEDWLQRHPELEAAPIDRPMFVFGLPRTGTTLTINLLASDPARRAFLRWEAYDPVPPPTPSELHAGPRYEAAQVKSDMSLQYAPQIAAIHHENGDSPTECQFLMTPSFCAQVYEALADIPSWRHWFLHEADYRPAFRFHKRMLQVLQQDAPGRWTLKNPWHPLFLNELVEVYPDAQLVMTHRDPAEVVGSCCSLIKYVRQIYSDDVDLEAIGRSFVDTFRIMIDRTLAFTGTHGGGSIHHVQYADTLRDPVGTVRSIYEHYGEPFTAPAEAAMRAYLADNKQGKHGRHVYDLAEYGLSAAEVRDLFGDYIEAFGIPVSA